jgi:hypothetical protein
MISNFSFWMVLTVAAAVCGHALSWRRRRRPLGQKARPTTANCRLQFHFQHGAVPNTLDCLSFLLIVFSRIGPFISQNNVSISFAASTDVWPRM